MKIRESNHRSSLGLALVIGCDGFPRVVETIDGDSTGLTAIVSAIIQAGFNGVRAAPFGGNMVDLQFNLATPEGAYIAYLRDQAIRGFTLPPVEKVMETLLPLRRSKGGQKKCSQ